MASLKEAATALANLTGKALRKRSKPVTYGDVHASLHELYRLGGYVPITRMEDLQYNTELLKALTTAPQNPDLTIMAEWARERGVKVDLGNPYDAARLILDALFETCLYGHKKGDDILSIKVMKKSLGLTYRGLCDLLRGLSEFAATQHSYKYLLHLATLFKELFTSYTGVEVKSVVDALRTDPETVEKFRVHITSKFFPTAKEYVTVLYLLKYKWPITEVILEESYGGMKTRKAIDPTYLGRITSELLDSMMGIYYDSTALQAYDTIVKAYFSVFQAISNDIERGYEINYIESHPVMLTYIQSIEEASTAATPQIRNHLRRRGMIRLGEVKQDVKDYVMTLFYLERESQRRGYAPVSSIRGYNIEALMRSALIKGEAPW